MPTHMNKNYIQSFVAFAVLFFSVIACGQPDQDPVIGHPSLKEVFQDAFLIGTALNKAQIYAFTTDTPPLSVERAFPRGYYSERRLVLDMESYQLARHHFNAVTPENVMKWEEIHPRPGEYVFDPVDVLVEMAEENDMFITGHTLVWHSQVPDWVFRDDRGQLLDREALLARMRDHIHTVVGRYKGRVQSWDVVNEALNEDGSLRESLWYEIIGEDYLLKAFQYAHEADPNAELYYNDYNLEVPSKREGAIRLVQQLQEAGAHITGIGTQSHFSLEGPDIAEIEKTIVEFSKLGIDVMITELDIGVLPAAFEYAGADVTLSAERTEELDPYTDGLPDEVQQLLADRYEEIFNVYLDHKDKISRVTFWGVTDHDSWRNYWPVRGRTAHPLLFDHDGEPKKAFYAVVALAQERLNRE